MSTQPATRFLTVPRDANVDGAPEVQRGTTALPFKAFFVEMVLPRLPRLNADDLQYLNELVVRLQDAEQGMVVELSERGHQVLLNALPTDISGRFFLRIKHFWEAVVFAGTEPPDP